MEEKEISVGPEYGYDRDRLTNYLIKKGIVTEGQTYEILLRSIDARGRSPKVRLRIGIDTHHHEFVEYFPDRIPTLTGKSVVIIGAGPAGLFAALKALEYGIKPIVIERGKDVRARRRDIAAINKEHIVNENSNYCFGEGGAGTYSDGKLYTRAKKRGSVRRIFEILVAHGATDEILFESHPHIGTNKLPKIITSIRNTILELGGEIHFNTLLTDFSIHENQITGVEINGQEKIETQAVILATGHSARDIYYLLDRQNILIESKPFALGVRVEHPQQIIDQIQYNQCPRDPQLPSAAYSIVNQTFYGKKQRGVFSFCMCPGGFIVPAATSPEEIVVNGMSPSRRNSKYANSGIVVAIENEDLRHYQDKGPLAALSFQKEIERLAWVAGGKRQTAPAQRLTDFVDGKVSTSLPETSYQPGVISTDMKEVLPDFVHERLKTGFRAFGKKLKGFLTNEAQIVGVESRTSSPVRIPRDSESLEHPQIAGLYPCGEGAGYAGGIVSAAMDGERVMERIAAVLETKVLNSK